MFHFSGRCVSLTVERSREGKERKSGDDELWLERASRACSEVGE